MASTVIRGAQIKDSTVQRHDLDTSTVGQAVVTKIVQGSGVTLSSTGADSGTGDVTVAASAIPLASSAQSGLLNQTSGNTTDFIDGTNNSQPLQPVIWSARLRSLNAVGNPNFEITQRSCGNTTTVSAASTFQFIEDRWYLARNFTTGAGLNLASVADVITVPGTSYQISARKLVVNLNSQGTPAAGDYIQIINYVEGPMMRELINDVHSVSILAYCSSAFKFTLGLRDSGDTRSFLHLCSLPAATWTLFKIPNIPVFASGGSWTTAPGSLGYQLVICLSVGSSNQSSTADSWISASAIGLSTQDNFASLPVGTQFWVGFVQHEPGVCTTPMDCSFTQNLLACQRYYQTSYPWGITKGTATASGSVSIFAVAGTWPQAWIPFSQRMAKSPSLNGYSFATGTLNTVRDTQANTDRSTSGTINSSDNGFSGFQLSSTNGSNAMYIFHYTADTGW